MIENIRIIVRFLAAWSKDEDATSLPQGFDKSSFFMSGHSGYVVSTETIAPGVDVMSFRGFGVRRGFFMAKDDGHFWYGATVAGNGTPAFWWKLDASKSFDVDILDHFKALM